MRVAVALLLGSACASVTTAGELSPQHGEILARRFAARHSDPRCVNRTTDGVKYIDNGKLRLGIDPNHGGTITYLAESNIPELNMINSCDMGRQIQQSYYAAPKFYNPDNKCNKLFNNMEWEWNPLGSGDVKGHTSAVQTLDTTASTAHIVSKPLQWACDNVPCECEFETSVTMDAVAGTGIKIEATLHNHRTDAYDATAKYPQELPALYTNAPFNRLVTYSGGDAFSGQKTTEYTTGWDDNKFPQWVPGTFTAAEGWAAMVNESGWGLGLVNPAEQLWIGGFIGVKGSGGPTDFSAGYMGPIPPDGIALGPNEVYKYTFYVVLGDLATIRSFAYEVQGHPPPAPPKPSPAPPPTPPPAPTPVPPGPPAPPNACANTAARKSDANCFGNDIDNAGLLASADECCAACAAREGCGAWTWWANEGPNKGQPWAGCWVKTGCPAPRADGTAVAGVMKGDFPPFG